MEDLGTITPILILSYQNCELICCHLDGYQSDRNALYERLLEVEALILSKPKSSKFRLWYNLDENNLDQASMKWIDESIFRLRIHIYKIAFIGLRGLAKWRFNQLLERIFEGKQLSKKYFTDAESAKGWLI